MESSLEWNLSPEPHSSWETGEQNEKRNTKAKCDRNEDVKEGWSEIQAVEDILQRYHLESCLPSCPQKSRPEALSPQTSLQRVTWVVGAQTSRLQSSTTELEEQRSWPSALTTIDRSNKPCDFSPHSPCFSDFLLK
jgi:hypothetical protein